MLDNVWTFLLGCLFSIHGSESGPLTGVNETHKLEINGFGLPSSRHNQPTPFSSIPMIVCYSTYKQSSPIGELGWAGSLPTNKSIFPGPSTHPNPEIISLFPFFITVVHPPTLYLEIKNEWKKPATPAIKERPLATRA